MQKTSSVWGSSFLDIIFHGRSEVGLLALQLSDKFREYAIRTLLVFDDSDGFFHELIRSGLCREAYLLRCENEGRLDDYYRCSGRYGPVLDVIAASDFAVARRVVALSPSEWREGSEPQGDFWYAQMLHGLVQDPVGSNALAPVLRMADDWTEPHLKLRRSLFASLVSVSQEAFDDAFARLLEEYCLEADPFLSQPDTQWHGAYGLFGTARGQQLRRRGLKTQDEYTYCPSVARIPMQEAFPGQ